MREKLLSLFLVPQGSSLFGYRALMIVCTFTVLLFIDRLLGMGGPLWAWMLLVVIVQLGGGFLASKKFGSEFEKPIQPPLEVQVKQQD